MKNPGLVVFSALLMSAATVASAGTLTATGEGWCSPSYGCNNTDTSAYANTFAGSNFGSLFQDWFAFALPATPIGSASISIWNDFENYNTDPSAVYNLYAASAFSYGGLATGPSLGSVSVTAADTGISEYITIDLNAAGIAALNADLGGTFVFGGAGGSNPALESEIFGYTDGGPIAMLTTGAVTTPEPSTFLLLGSGLLGALGTIRRKIRL